MKLNSKYLNAELRKNKTAEIQKHKGEIEEGSGLFSNEGSNIKVI